MASSSSSVSSVASYRNSSMDVDAKTPLWAFTTITSGGAGGGGNKDWICRFCEENYSSSYSRVKAHFMWWPKHGIGKCTKITTAQQKELQVLLDQVDERSKVNLPPLPRSGGLASQSDSLTSSGIGGVEKKRKGPTGALAKAFNIEAREKLKSEIARMLYTGGLPFHLARNPYYQSSYIYAANNSIDGFIPPGYNALRTTLLEQERAHVERMLKPIKETWHEKGISLVSDGWSDPQRRPLINFMAASDGCPIFLKAIDGSGEYKDKHFIARLMIDTINELGANNVVQVITDNAPVCKAAGLIVEGNYPHIFWTPCVVHTLNLALKNICAANASGRNPLVAAECYWIKEVSDDAIFVRNFINNHSMRLSMFNSFVPLKLLTVAETRFASAIVMLRRFKLIKSGLKNLVVSDEWDDYRADDVELAKSVKDIILNDLWWDKVEYILSFTRPIYEMLRLCDTDKPTLHLVYDMWDSMIEEVKRVIFRKEGRGVDAPDEESTFFKVVFDILVARWTKSCTPLHCMAHSLCPRYYSTQWLSQGPKRLAAHRDREISHERAKCLGRYFPELEERNEVLVEFAMFSTSQPPFDTSECLENRWHLDPKVWWINYGSSTPKLQTLALKLLGQPCSSSCCERNWSTYSFIHSLRRNKILPKRAEDLVYVHTNLRLLSRKTEAYGRGETKMWDIGGDQWDSFVGTGVLEVASLSLDEPEMEAMIFNEGGSDEVETLLV